MVATGPWLNELLRPIGPRAAARVRDGPGLGVPRHRLGRAPVPDRVGPRRASRRSYGLPVAGSGYKLGLTADQQLEARTTTSAGPTMPSRWSSTRRVTEGFVGLGPRPTRTERCPVTTTPDGGFLIDRRGADRGRRRLLRARLHVLARARRADRRSGGGLADRRNCSGSTARTLDRRAPNLLKTAVTRSTCSSPG